MQKVLAEAGSGKASKKLGKSGQADRFEGEGGSTPPPSRTASICESFDQFLSFIKWQNNPKYDNLSRIFHIFLTASGEGGVDPSGQPDRFFPIFFLITSLRGMCKKRKKKKLTSVSFMYVKPEMVKCYFFLPFSPQQ